MSGRRLGDGELAEPPFADVPHVNDVEVRGFSGGGEVVDVQGGPGEARAELRAVPEPQLTRVCPASRDQVGEDPAGWTQHPTESAEKANRVAAQAGVAVEQQGGLPLAHPG